MSRFDKKEVEETARELLNAASNPSVDGAAAIYARDYLRMNIIEGAERMIAISTSHGRVSERMKSVIDEVESQKKQKKTRGRPKHHRPRHWMEISASFHSLRSATAESPAITYQEAVTRLKEEYGLKRTSIIDALDFSNEVEKAIDRLMSDNR